MLSDNHPQTFQCVYLSNFIHTINITIIMDYDEILDDVGHFSKWHKWQFGILTLFQTAAVFATLSYSFTGMN